MNKKIRKYHSLIHYNSGCCSANNSANSRTGPSWVVGPGFIPPKWGGTNEHFSLCAPWSQSTRRDMKLFTDANLISLHFLRRRVRLTVGSLGSWLTDLRFGSMNIVPECPLKIHWQWCQHWRQRNILLRTQRKPGLTTKSTNAKIEGYLAELRRAGFTQSMFALTQKSRQK